MTLLQLTTQQNLRSICEQFIVRNWPVHKQLNYLGTTLGDTKRAELLRVVDYSNQLEYMLDYVETEADADSLLNDYVSLVMKETSWQ